MGAAPREIRSLPRRAAPKRQRPCEQRRRERRRRDKSVRESQRRLRHLGAAAGVAFVVDSDGAEDGEPRLVPVVAAVAYVDAEGVCCALHRDALRSVVSRRGARRPARVNAAAASGPRHNNAPAARFDDLDLARRPPARLLHRGGAHHDSRELKRNEHGSGWKLNHERVRLAPLCRLSEEDALPRKHPEERLRRVL